MVSGDTQEEFVGVKWMMLWNIQYVYSLELNFD